MIFWIHLFKNNFQSLYLIKQLVQPNSKCTVPSITSSHSVALNSELFLIWCNYRRICCKKEQTFKDFIYLTTPILWIHYTTLVKTFVKTLLSQYFCEKTNSENRKLYCWIMAYTSICLKNYEGHSVNSGRR